MADDGLPGGAKRRWGAEQRLEFVELRAFWDGSLNRGDIREQFGVSAPQASADIATYIDLAPGNLVYDGSLKRYLSAEGFTPRLVKPSAVTYLRHLIEDPVGAGRSGNAWLATTPNFATTPMPGRAVDAQVLRGLLATMRQQASVEILYQSMSPARPAPLWRRVTPHCLATDGLRWHVRAYCHEDDRFKDFVLSRIRDTRSADEAGALGSRDLDWNTTIEVRLVPNPDLSSEQRAAVDWDYQMNGAGVLNLEVRRALLYYLRQRLRLDVPYDRPAERPVVLADAAGFDEEIERAKGAVAALG
jgi:hypothetical protein